MNIKKAPLCKWEKFASKLSAKLTEGLFCRENLLLQSLRHGKTRTPKARNLASGNPVAVPPPFTQGRLFSTFRKVRKRLLICRCQKCLCVTFVIVGCVGFLFYYFFCFWDQIPGNKANSSRTRRNNIQSPALRCQDKQ